MFIHGYKFPNNNAAIEQICNDKSALSDLLSAHRIPHVPHSYFSSSYNKQNPPPQDNRKRMQSLLQEYGKIVCKPNAATGGYGVFKVSSQRELEFASQEIFSASEAMSISPYRKIQAEYRVIIVNASVGVIYEKKFRVPDADEIVEVSRKHNLEQGARPVIVTDVFKTEILSELALSCVAALDAEFVSVDIVEDECGFEVLEINSGVMMENFAASNPENYEIAKNIYQKAILHYLNMDTPRYQYSNQRPGKTNLVPPVLEETARERGVQMIPDKEKGNFAIFVFKNGKRFVAKDHPLNINYAGSISLCINKAACARFLHDMGFQIPRQKTFARKADPDITLSDLSRCFENPEERLGFGFPMILKPNGLSQGTGVYKVFNAKDGLLAARNVLALKEKTILLEEYCPGSDYRIVVLNGQVIQAYERIPFHVVGNGHDTIRTLLQKQADAFEKANRDKTVDTEDPRILRNIIHQGYTLNTVLNAGVICTLQDVANLSLGGTARDLTDRISPYYSELAISIAESLNLKLCGIDIIAKDITDMNRADYYVIEVNSAPILNNHAFDGKKQEKYVKELHGMVFDFLESL
jgi:glutathione synthase/RimK-type ligase-like ATP-grasp enzyme